MVNSRHILVIRFSALGDVAMTVPVIKLALQQHPNLHITMLSDPFMAPFFEGMERLHFIGASTKKEYKGLTGLWRLAQQLRKQQSWNAVADLHDVLRTKLIRFFLFTRNKAIINKGRAEKKSLIRPHNKQLRPLKSGFERYADVFAKLGFPIKLEKEGGLLPRTITYRWLPDYQAGQKLIGIAPFARHAAKMYPLEKMKEVIRHLAADSRNRVILLGSKTEASELKDWEMIGENVYNFAGHFDFRDELRMISSLHLVISMDSANMHLASLFGVPVISIWGGTHPWLGFYGWGQDPANAVQSNLPCRPSSVFGNKPCPVHGEAGCMQEITPQEIIGRFENFCLRNQ